jgi:iron complex outermembrane receptor protein
MQFINDDPILYSYGIGNVPMAHIYGGEFEADWRATEHLRLEGNLSLQHGSFTDDYQALNPITATARRRRQALPGPAASMATTMRPICRVRRPTRT